jgi:uncharacterized protein (TIGR03067 family)
MKAILITATIFLWTATTGAGGADQEADRLKGSWLFMVPASDRENAPPGAAYSQPDWKIEVGKIRMSYLLHLRSADETEFGMNATYRLDPSKEKKQIDVTFLDGKRANKTLLGIYALQGDVLLIALSTRDGHRATDFVDNPGEGARLFVFRRAKSKVETGE